MDINRMKELNEELEELRKNSKGIIEQFINDLKNVVDGLKTIDNEKYESITDILEEATERLEDSIKEEDQINYRNNKGQINISTGNGTINASQNIKF